MSRIARYLTQFCIIFTVTIALWASAEGIARLVVRQIKWAPPVYMMEYTDDVIRKVYNTDDPGFYREVMREGWGRAINVEYEPFVEFIATARAGKHVNIAPEGFRRVPTGPESLDVPGKRIFVFGGSTTFGMGVADHETIPAYLEAAFREHGRDDVNVFNFGIVGYYSTQERVLFERLINLGHVPDAAVFIDGLNDFVFCEIPDATGMSTRIKRVLSGQAGVTLLETYQRRSSILKVFRYYTEGIDVARDRPSAHCTGDASQTRAIVRRLDTNRRTAAGVAKAFGVLPVFVHQPVPAYAYDNTKRAVSMPEARSTPWAQIRRGYEIFRERREKGEAYDEDVLWLEEAAIAENMYIDEVHYSPQFNRHIARRIREFLETRLKP